MTRIGFAKRLACICLILVSNSYAVGEEGDLPGRPEDIDAAKHAAERASRFITVVNGVRIYNLNSRDRIPGKYLVVLKRESDLRSVPKVGENAPEVRPDIVPTTKETIRLLSEGYAERLKGAAGGILNKSPRGFFLSEISEEDVKNVLTKDPRVDWIEAQLNYKPDTTQSLPTDNSIWHLDRLDQRALPLNHAFQYATDGDGVYVHLVDTGLRITHEEFEGRAGAGNGQGRQHGCSS